MGISDKMACRSIGLLVSSWSVVDVQELVSYDRSTTSCFLRWCIEVFISCLWHRHCMYSMFCCTCTQKSELNERTVFFSLKKYIKNRITHQNHNKSYIRDTIVLRSLHYYTIANNVCYGITGSLVSGTGSYRNGELQNDGHFCRLDMYVRILY